MNAFTALVALASSMAPSSVLERIPVSDAAFDPALACYAAVETDGADAELAAIFELAKGEGDDARAALRLLAAAGGAHARASLAAALCGHRDPATRAQAADLLGDDREPESVFVLAIAADVETDPEVRDVVIANLERLVGPATAERERARARAFVLAVASPH